MVSKLGLMDQEIRGGGAYLLLRNMLQKLKKEKVLKLAIQPYGL
jgi:hypothetical protein